MRLCNHRLASLTRLFFSLAISMYATATVGAQRVNFDKGWHFALGHAADPEKDFGFSEGSFSAFSKSGTSAGPIGLGFSDDAWRTVDLPHDWAIELPFDPSADLMHGYKPVGRPFPQNSVGWYRKGFEVPKEDQGKRILITFDGVYRDAYVWVNGHLLGRNASGYMGFSFDLTDYVRYGTPNVISVRVDASDFEGWFYEGAGIYRHVWLTTADPVHFEEDGVLIQPTVGTKESTVYVGAEIRNETPELVTQAVTVTVKDAEGKVVGKATGKPVGVRKWSSRVVDAEVGITSVHLWSIEDPYLYTCEVTTSSDKYVRKIGFRTFRFDPDKGFFLNEKPLKIQGTCNHQDHAGVGAAVPDRLNEWRIAQLKKYGCNAYRTSHNPPTPELLDACDRLGMIVMDETRMFGSTGEARSQLERLVMRDRNHPSVVFWSIGNEEWATQNTEESARIATSMKRTIQELDGTRPITFAANNGGELGGINSVVDVRGFNYNLGAVDAYHKARPKQPVHGSEVASTVTTRGEYANDKEKAYMAAYDVRGVDWGSSAEEWWKVTLEREWFAGGFVWTGFDYRGEPTPYAWPNVSSHFGVLDTCGFWKDVTYYYQAMWTKEPVLHIFPTWNQPKNAFLPVDVWVFSNHEEVELFLNGRSLGRKKMTYGDHLSWSVPYEKGKLSAIGYRGGQKVQEASVETTGPATQIVVETERSTIDADGSDVAIVTVRAVDDMGRTVPDAMNKIDFALEGPGKIIGVGNGDPSCHEPDTMISTPNLAPITGWKMKRVTGDPTKLAEILPDFDDSGWEANDLHRNQLREPGTMAVFRSTFNIEDPASRTVLGVGPIDDLGWIFLNGKLLGTTNDWAASSRHDVEGKLKKGRNVLAIVVKNNGGEGGLTKGVQLVGSEIQPSWSRSLFHGLAQVIIKSTGKPGDMTLRATSNELQTGALSIKAN